MRPKVTSSGKQYIQMTAPRYCHDRDAPDTVTTEICPPNLMLILDEASMLSKDNDLGGL